MKNFKYIFIAVFTAVLLHACSPAENNFPGSEYMPDMAHSVAYEANSFNYYFYNTWDSVSTFKLKELSNPRLPVKGTIPRGYAGVHFADAAARPDVMKNLTGQSSPNAIAIPLNGSVPYYYGNTEEERLRATAEIIANPFPITEDGLARGKELYDVFCGICHGEKGDGLGYLVSESNPNAKYPAAPAVLISDDFIASSNGRMYHAIMYGKNVMGAYADKLGYEERWQVIHYIRQLQAKEKKLAYSATENTLNPAFGTPAGQIEQMATVEPAVEEAHGEGEHHSDGGH
jgi:mono/diheme cytochrome c family protein